MNDVANGKGWVGWRVRVVLSFLSVILFVNMNIMIDDISGVWPKCARSCLSCLVEETLVIEQDQRMARCILVARSEAGSLDIKTNATRSEPSG